ncbi:hypothetical protein OA669_00740 [Candidatus Pelagibacter bacterium]|nr:hypothetical protein [Candidatus Pelagibacter bacterium]
MKKILLLLSTIFLLTGCAESLALLGSGASNGRLVQSSLNSAISYGVKKQTGKTPFEHAIAYAETKNPERKKETCISSFEITRSEFCKIAKKKISLTNTVLTEKTIEIAQKFSKITKKKEISLIERIAKKSSIYNRR